MSPDSNNTPAAPSPAAPLGASVRLSSRPSYLKTADPMPMLRPPDLVDAGEVGVVVALRSLEQRAVRFRRGTFLVAAADLEPADQPV
ncbi:MAG: NAD(P)H dehydrogenase assembly family protein [Cyanobacteriota bacterium]